MQTTKTITTLLCGVLLGIVGIAPLHANADTGIAYYGIHKEDRQAVDAMLPDQPLIPLGMIDVTKPPFSADPTGKADATKAINDAVFFGRHHKLAVWFPLGTYTVSDTIKCAGGWSDYRTPNNKYLPYTEVWPCVLIGERRDGQRPVVALAPESPGFDQPKTPKVVFDFFGTLWVRESMDAPLPVDSGAANYHQLLYGIDVRISSGNPGAAVVSFDAAEGSTLQDCTFDVGDGEAGIFRGPGSGGAVFNVTVRGGRVGARMTSSRPNGVLAGCRFIGQREMAVKFDQRGVVTLVGCEFRLAGDAVALESGFGRDSDGVVDPRWQAEAKRWPGRVDFARTGSSLVDCRIEREAPHAKTPVVRARGPVYMRDIWVKGGGTLLASEQVGAVELPAGDGWSHVDELASPHDFAGEPTASVFVDGEKIEGVWSRMQAGGAPPENLCSRHIRWDPAVFPAWNSPGIVNVREAPYHAKGDGQTDDTEALQRAIDENKTLFLPKGAYRITKTLQLKPETRIIGLSPSYCMVVPVATEDSDFGDMANPQPALRTADAEQAETVLAFFSVFMPREDARGASMIDWACPATLRSVNPISCYTDNDLMPLADGIRPWNDWTWPQMDAFSEATGVVKHSTIHARKWTASWRRKDKLHPDWPLVRVHGHGAGAMYPFYALDGRVHGAKRRRVLVENTKGPFAIYQAHFQYCCGDWEMEICNASNVAIYGIKSEGGSPIMGIFDSHNVFVSGLGATPWEGFLENEALFSIQGSRDITLCNLMTDWLNGKPANNQDAIRAELPGGTTFTSGPNQRPAMFKIQP